MQLRRGATGPVLRPGPTARSGGPVLRPVRSSPAVLPGERTVATEQFVRNDRETFSAALGSGGPWDRTAPGIGRPLGSGCQRAGPTGHTGSAPTPPAPPPPTQRHLCIHPGRGGGTSAYTRVAAEAPLHTPGSRRRHLCIHPGRGGGTSAYTRVAAEAPLRTPRSAWAGRPAGAGHSPSPTTSADGAGPDGTSLGEQALRWIARGPAGGEQGVLAVQLDPLAAAQRAGQLGFGRLHAQPFRVAHRAYPPAREGFGQRLDP